MEDDKNNPLVKLLINVSFVEEFESSTDKLSMRVSNNYCWRPSDIL
jgi:hypothetical protein